MLVIDEYLAVDVVRGDWPDELPDDDVLGLPVTCHYRLLQRIHDPGNGQLSTILGRLSPQDREAIRRPHAEIVQVLDPRPILDQAASISARYHAGGFLVPEILAAGLTYGRQLWFGTPANVGRRMADIAADLGISIHIAGI
jgi:hypothetical protein